jgi:uncharacterized protein with HEPN domain
MPLEENDPVHLWDMQRAALDIARFVAGRTFEDFVEDRQLRLAVERSIEIIGEAASRLSGSFREAHADIPIRAMISQRNVIIHGYDVVDPELVWKTVEEDLPLLLTQLKQVLADQD